ncbi:glycosyl transferase 2 family protein [Halobacteriovorax sp. BALOs_7]|uniref:Glycosyltransferase n=1 Tax=Halobacteriovorax vibrionivorans TaxID=2152716 RepID=A0ABY0IK98_9BACT|nr:MULTISPECIES: glycosyltransferase [Halobacteriovorax]AYF43040.1 glycosyl transferase 2 family protein [Halobacteriovorax sp. BALOs_7]RZF23067.1 glycosyltransferase [Halobacteriovorax vibrionivorans]TGD49302.1 glycosyltransferase [Halobacteriovorax sp. Y22]
MQNRNNPLVSVAIVTYNHEKFITECLDSVLSQDYNNVEIVISDDNSTDNTVAIINNFIKNRKTNISIKIITSNINEGVTANTNKAHFNCKGKYIAWLGGDDLMLPGKIRKQVEILESNSDCNIVFHNLDVFDSESGKTLFLFSNLKRSNYQKKDLIKLGCINGACSNMVRRSATPPHGFYKYLPVAADWLYWIETIGNGTAIYINEVLGKYRRHSNNVTLKTNNISQADIDHLNTCNYLIKNSIKYFNEIRFRQSQIIFSLRNKMNYLECLKYSLSIRINLKALIALIVYYLTFTKYKFK